MDNDVLVIGSGIAGLSSAIFNAEQGKHVMIVSPHGSDRAQSIMAAGGINAVMEEKEDSYIKHAEDTLKGGAYLENPQDVQALCKQAPELIHFLEQCGVILNRKQDSTLDSRAFGGQSYKRTHFAGSATGKIIVTALVQKVREYECKGLISRRHHLYFYEALIKDGRCYGAAFYNELTNQIEHIYAANTIVATGGMNQLFGNTTGSTFTDGYATSKLFEQGVTLRNLEFVQYHPTTIETHYKKMLISEAARGEGGRLFYFNDDNSKCYFMEEKYGNNGNLMSRDIVSKCMCETNKQIYLDLTFLSKDIINNRLSEIKTICKDYLNIDITKEYIPVEPSVHFFMGGIAVDANHQTNIQNLYAVGECASKYHGANRLGGNSLLAALYGSKKASDSIKTCVSDMPDFATELKKETQVIQNKAASRSEYPVFYMLRELSQITNSDLGIVRNEENMKNGIESLNFFLSVIDKIAFDSDVAFYQAYSIKNKLLLAKAILTSALARKESRGAHIRSDYPEMSEEFHASSYAKYVNGEIQISFNKDFE